MSQVIGRVETSSGALALSCLAHMQQEEAMLSETLESLRQVRAALLSGDLDSLKFALERQTRVAHASVELRERRAGLRREMSTALGVPPRDVTLLRFASGLPRDITDHLIGCRERLRTMAAEVDRINRANAALVGQSLDFLERFLTEITDGDPGGTGYTARGASREPVLGSIIEARG